MKLLAKWTALLTLASSVPMATLLADTIPAGTDVSLINKGGEQAFRQRVIRAYLPLDEVKKRLKTNNYSAFENPTGIFMNEGETVTITVKGEAVSSLELVVHNWGAQSSNATYPLQAGENNITLKNSGLAYLDYRSMSPQNAPALDVQIQGGVINGLFTTADDATTWEQMLANAKCDMIDLLGERVHMVLQVEALRQNCPKRGDELLALYDRIIKIQQDLMGFELFKIHPGNHMLGRNIWNGFMYADGTGAAFIHSSMKVIGNPDALVKQAWGVAHEFGHVNQTRPGFCWVGTTEVSNNVFSSWTNYLLNPSSMRLEHEVTPSPNGHLRGGRFHSYLQAAIVEKQIWQFYRGPDFNFPNPYTPQTVEESVKQFAGNADFFVQLCPLWQLQLYMAVVCGKEDFYPQIFQRVREADESNMHHGEMRINFMKYACDASGLDLSEFFVMTRMLAPINRWKTDYSSRMLTISSNMVKECLQHASQYPKPDSRVIYYINSNNVEIFKARQGIVQGSKLRPVQGKITVPAGDWAGSVAFEVYAGEKLLGVSCLGLGHEDDCTTDVFVPESATKVVGVAWDGKRTMIWSK